MTKEPSNFQLETNLINEVPYEAIIADLNEKSGRRYRHTSPATRKLIKARCHEGFTLEDFRTVHTNMCNRWFGTDFEQYLRPSTLYRASKFEGYLNDRQGRRSVLSRTGQDSAKAAQTFIGGGYGSD